MWERGGLVGRGASEAAGPHACSLAFRRGDPCPPALRGERANGAYEGASWLGESCFTEGPDLGEPAAAPSAPVSASLRRLCTARDARSHRPDRTTWKEMAPPSAASPAPPAPAPSPGPSSLGRNSKVPPRVTGGALVSVITTAAGLWSDLDRARCARAPSAPAPSAQEPAPAPKRTVRPPPCVADW